MPEEVRLWQISPGDRLVQVRTANLELEARLEAWIEQDVSILSPHLMIIGRQVETGYGGVIDLLCLDESGDLAIVELKRDRTPRDVAAQVLDYASWVRELSNEQITRIAQGYLGPTSLEEAFSKQFGSDLPEVLNENHSMLIVGSRIDASTERIIKYLSDAHGVSINAVNFQFHRMPDGTELLARLFLVEPEAVEYRARTKGSSRRGSALSYDELAQIASDQGVGELYQKAIETLGLYLSRKTTRSSIGFTKDIDGGRKTIVNLVPTKSTPEDGLYFQVYFERFCRWLGIEEGDALHLLPEISQPWKYYSGADPDYSGYDGYFVSREQVECFLAGIRDAAER